MTPEALRRRMAHGNIYAAEKVDAALANYFRPGNLAALRELALLWVADRVDEALERVPRAPRHRRAVGDPRAGASSPSPARPAASTSSGGRPASRQRAHGELLGVHVRSRRRPGRPTPPAARRAPPAARASSAASYHEVAGADVAAALVDFARAENATQLVLGASRRSRWAELVAAARSSTGSSGCRARSTCTSSRTTTPSDDGDGRRRPSRRRPARRSSPRRRLLGLAARRRRAARC